jgi:AbiJ N-terminal domain 3
LACLYSTVVRGLSESWTAHLRREIHQHVFKNPEDWSAEYLFQKLGAFEASNGLFKLFIEGLASARVRPDVDSQRDS